MRRRLVLALPAVAVAAAIHADVAVAQDAGVLAAQRQLRALGYSVGADGFTGARTEEAVRQFQAAAGLPVTGELDPPTRETLFADPMIAAILAGDVAQLRTLLDAGANANYRAGQGPVALLVAAGEEACRSSTRSSMPALPSISRTRPASLRSGSPPRAAMPRWSAVSLPPRPTSICPIRKVWLRS